MKLLILTTISCYGLNDLIRRDRTIKWLDRVKSYCDDSDTNDKLVSHFGLSEKNCTMAVILVFLLKWNFVFISILFTVEKKSIFGRLVGCHSFSEALQYPSTALNKSYYCTPLRTIRRSVSRSVLQSLVSSLVLSRRRLDYGYSTLAVVSSYLHRLQSVLNAAARLIFSSSRFQHITPLLRQLHWPKAPERIAFKHSVLVYKCLHGSAHAYVTDELCQVADSLPDRVKQSFAIFDIQALWCPILSVRVPGCLKL